MENGHGGRASPSCRERESRYLTLQLLGQPLLRRTLSLQLHERQRQRIAVQYHLEGLAREELDAYLGQQLKAAGVTEPLYVWSVANLDCPRLVLYAS